MTEQTQPTDAKLLPCPFCGTQPDECDIGQFVVECPICAIVGPASDNSSAARRAWNTRWGTPAGAGPVLWPTTCDGKEQEAWETWAKSEHYDMAQHPLHYIFLNDRTFSARQGWRAGLLYAVEQMKAATPQPTQAQAGAVPLTDEQCDAIYEALDEFGREVDHYEYGLPYCTSDGETLAKPEAREVIRQAAQNIKGAAHGVADIKGGQHGTDT